MTDTPGPDIRLVPHLLRTRAPFAEMVECYRRFALPSNPTVEQWTEAVGAATSMCGSALGWISGEERAALFEMLISIVQDAITKFWPEEAMPRTAIRGALSDFTACMETQRDDRLLQFCWDVLSARPRRRSSGAYTPLLWMNSSGRLSGAMSFENIELAITLLDEAEAMYWWPAERWRLVRWPRDSQPYCDGLLHSSCIVRATAARALGELFYGCGTQPAAEAPLVAETLALIRNCERKTPGVAGPFLQGAHWSTDPFLAGQPFDFRGWFLDMLRGGGREPWVPHMQSLEYYAHQFFARDGAAIEQMLEMGRDHLALLTATTAPDAIPDLMPVLTKMSDSRKPWIAQAMRKYLVVRRRHAGVGALES